MALMVVFVLDPQITQVKLYLFFLVLLTNDGILFSFD